VKCKKCGGEMVKVNFYVWKCTATIVTPLLQIERECSFRTTTDTSERIRSLVESGRWNGRAALMKTHCGRGWQSAPIACPYACPRDFYNRS
jgi:hypothetical protein